MLPSLEKLEKTPHACLETGREEAARHVTSLTRSAAPVKAGPPKLGLWLSAGLSALVGDFYDCPAVPNSAQSFPLLFPASST